jgi:hypothetical protein
MVHLLMLLWWFFFTNRPTKGFTSPRVETENKLNHITLGMGSARPTAETQMI